MEKVQTLQRKKIFFDTNIWLYLFGNIGNTDRSLIRKYSSQYRDILKQGIAIYTDVTVISEFVNRYLRTAHSVYCQAHRKCDFKFHYRKTKDYKTAWKEVCYIVNSKILSKAKPINTNYNSSTIKTLLNANATQRDFNDNHIVYLCRAKDLILLTHDGDFKNAGIEIKSENKTYLKA